MMLINKIKYYTFTPIQGFLSYCIKTITEYTSLFLIFIISLGVIDLTVYVGNFLIFYLFLPLFSALFIILLPRTSINLIRQFALQSSIWIFGLGWIFFTDLNIKGALFTQFGARLRFFEIFDTDFLIGLDGLSYFFIMLSAFLIIICILVSWESIIYRTKEFFSLLFILEFLLFAVFLNSNLILFYIFFEAGLIPMFLIIGIWGSRYRRIYAAYQFFFYTFFGSVFMLLGIIYLYHELGCLDFEYIYRWGWTLSTNEQLFIWLALFIGLAVKVPMLPVHLWLPEAHVEAPTAGSVLLAGILLKLGGYGFIRFLVPMFPFATGFFMPFAHTISIISIIYSSFVTIRQIDLKKIIAYSSIAHMNFVTLGILSLNTMGINGGILLMFSHGIISSALFICIGIMYDRYKTRIIYYYGGLVRLMPLYSIFFFIMTFANLGFPGTANFIGEVLVLVGSFQVSNIAALFALFGTIFGAIYSVWLYNRLIFGKIFINFITEYSDINKREFFILFILSFLNFIIGVIPFLLLDVFDYSITLTTFFYDLHADWGGIWTIDKFFVDDLAVLNLIYDSTSTDFLLGAHLQDAVHVSDIMEDLPTSY